MGYRNNCQSEDRNRNLTVEWQLRELGGGKGAGMKAAVLPSFAAHAWVWAHASKTLLDIYEEMLELNRELKVIAQVIL